MCVFVHIGFTLSVKFANSFVKISTFDKNLCCLFVVFNVGYSDCIQTREICFSILTHDVFSASIPPGRIWGTGAELQAHRSVNRRYAGLFPTERKLLVWDQLNTKKPYMVCTCSPVIILMEKHNR